MLMCLSLLAQGFVFNQLVGVVPRFLCFNQMEIEKENCMSFLLLIHSFLLFGMGQITTFNISLVVHGTVSESNFSTEGGQDPYAVPKSMGIFQVIESPKDITTSSVAQRIIANHEIYVKRNTKKAASEKKYYAERKYVSGD